MVKVRIFPTENEGRRTGGDQRAPRKGHANVGERRNQRGCQHRNRQLQGIKCDSVPILPKDLVTYY